MKCKRFGILILTFVLTSCTLAIRQFKDEYPNVTVCESTLTTNLGFYDMPESYRFLKAHFNGQHKCTHIEGHLIIKNIWQGDEKLDFGFLENVEEVSGIVKIVNNTIDNVILPKLRVIRGQCLDDCLRIRWKDKQKYTVALYMKADYPLQAAHLILPSLKVISNHSVYFSSKSEHPYLPYSIRWTELFEDENYQRLLTVQLPKNSFQCHRSCNLTRENSTQAYCWSTSSDHCQQRTKCLNKDYDSSTWCFFKPYKNESLERLCNHQCTGGCYGVRDDQCYACKNYINGDRCTTACPGEYVFKNGVKVLNPDYKLRVAMMCARACPSNLLQQMDACIYKCTNPEFYRVNDKCEPCRRKGGCNSMECKIEDEDSCDKADSSSFFMTKPVLERLTNCDHVIGQMHFSVQSFTEPYGNITVPLLYRHLKHVKVITGNLAIDGSSVNLHNLTFLENLQEIRHLKQKQCKRQGDTALNIFDTDLQFMGLRRLRHIFGDFFEEGNKHLCYLDTIPWQRHVLKMNQFKSTSKSCNKSCDAQCGVEGCWGPSSSMCYICTGVRAGYNCVQRCEDAPGYYTGDGIMPENHSLPISYDDGTCRKCHPWCKLNCTGPSSSECIDGCRFFKEGARCVEICSKELYASGTTCKACSPHCMDDPTIARVCTGGGDHLGDGGCTHCSGFIRKGKHKSCYHGQCPSGYYATIDSNKSRVCMPCTEPCAMCSGSSVSTHDCKQCNGFWSRSICVKQCTEMSGLVQPTVFGGTCQVCHPQCDGCSSHDNDTHCVSCRNKRVYLSSHSSVFRCVESCPPSSSHYYRMNGLDLCLTDAELLRYNQEEWYKRLLNIICWIIGPTVAILLLAALIIFLMFKRSKRTKASRYLKAVYSNIHEPDSKVLLLNKESSLAQPNMNRLLLIPTTNIDFDINGRPLGKGAFGSVYRGKWKLAHDTELDVAIKVIKVVNQKAMEELLAETKVMASVSHKHCLRLIGVCLREKQPCLVTTFMELGSLDKYLKKHRNTLSSFTLLSWAEQIANGMAYLEMRGIIHRDLATRNVLLNSAKLVQITDFGLSRILQGTEDNHEIVISSGQVPIRWLAPETLDHWIYSHKTDVWAYGVTLWEIFSFGERPYDDMSLKDIPEFLRQNNRLSQPEICSLEIYTEMLSCWKEPQYRSTFEELMTKFSAFSNHPTYYLNIPNDPCLINTQYSITEEYDGHVPLDRSKAYMWKNMYRQLPSLDGTIVTCLEDYPDADGNAKVRRQSSNLSYLSGRIIFSDNHEGISPLLFQSSTLRECVDEDDGYLEPKKTRYSTVKPKDDHEYLEPISKYSMSK